MKKRILSLDILRGLTVALMIIVNNPGSWSNIFPPLRHAAWDGCTPTDLVFPFFLFCVGASMVFSLDRFETLNAKAAAKIFKRGAGIFLVGLALNAFPFFPLWPDPELSAWQNWLQWLSELRIFGVLQRIALSYIVASVIVLWLRKEPKKIIVAMAALSAAHVASLLLFAGPEGAFTLEGCAARRLDEALFGASHLYDGYRYADGTRAAFDPEGLLGVLTGACTAMTGYLAGQILRRGDETPMKIARLYTWAAVSLALSQILSIWIPVNKPLWSVSYVFFTAGWAMLVLAFITWMTDIKGWVKPFTPLRAFGMNPLAIYSLSTLMAITLGSLVGWNYSAVFGANEWMSLLYAILFMLFHLAVAMVLYKKNIVIKL